MNQEVISQPVLVNQTVVRNFLKNVLQTEVNLARMKLSVVLWFSCR